MPKQNGSLIKQQLYFFFNNYEGSNNYLVIDDHYCVALDQKHSFYQQQNNVLHTHQLQLIEKCLKLIKHNWKRKKIWNEINLTPLKIKKKHMIVFNRQNADIL